MKDRPGTPDQPSGMGSSSELEEEFISVAEMQRKIMPDPNIVRRYHDFDIYGGTLPIQWVGGDFYDFISLKGFHIQERLGLVIADVSGHGLSAAMLVRDFNTALYAGIAFEAHYANDTTPLLFEILNSRMFRSSLANQYITAFYGELHPDGKFRYINAGHLAPLLFRSHGVRPLREGGPVLGAFEPPPVPYQVGEVMMNPGDLLVAYSDGILEAVDQEDREYGVERLQHTVRQYDRRPVREIFQAVLKDVDTFTHEAPRSDDRTLIIVRKRA
ncbi:MAG TPA: PP2C family protein-serine/threonine phosphatase [Acidobacteriota bacterium]|nr:PP2C family protein-serine/threonine phosphatase [Acidobacteriota bacterium]